MTTTTSTTETDSSAWPAETIAGELLALVIWLRQNAAQLPTLRSSRIAELTTTIATAYVGTAEEFATAMDLLGVVTIDDPRPGATYVRASRAFGALAIAIAAPIEAVCERVVTGIEIMPDGRRVEVTQWRLIPPGRRATREENLAGIEASKDAIANVLCGPGRVPDLEPFTPTDPDGAPVAVIDEPDQVHEAFRS